jgi:hypothetical protein
VDRSTTSDGHDLQARIVLPRTILEAGTSMHAHVIVENGTGSDLVGVGCGPPFALTLVNDEVKQSIIWPLCAQTITIPQGESTWTVTVDAIYTACGDGEGLVPCPDDERMPPLPVGEYRVLLVQHPRLVPDPVPVVLHVTP